ncbi:MAG TPA: protein kinase [Vicinamibacterales bacterium]|jgi:serine/threonine protein kinase/WD40 repeat protein
MALGPGARLGTFEIVSTLGAGGMGIVYRAHDTRLRRDVALKILPDTFAGDPERLDRFQREAQAIAALNHPNVVTIYSVEERDGLHFLTMELIEGTTLVDVIRPGGLSLDTLLTIALPLADAISAAHQRSIVHRDLKPANVMVTADQRVKVLDFGLAKLKQDVYASPEPSLATTAQLTAQHSVLGTPSYMSPEQAEGKPVDARTDIFSLGVMLYEMATGVRPFHGDSSLAILSSILKDTPSSMLALRPDLPLDFDRIVRRCLAKDPTRRYQTSLDVRNELEDVQRQISSRSASAVPGRPSGGRRGWRTIAATAVVMALVVAAAALLWRARVDRESGAPSHMTFDHLTSQSGAELFPSVSPDGKWIVYTGEASGNRDIYLQSVSGQTAINLTKDSPDEDEQPAFSPDGERIAFRSSRDGGGIFVMGRTGEGVRRLTRAGFNPAWSPDGSAIAFASVATEIRPQNAEQRGRIMVVVLNQGEPRELATDGMLPAWSPHGKRIAFSGRLSGAAGVSNLATVAASGGEPAVPVTTGGFMNWNPIWTHDGTQLYFVSNRGGTMNIWRVAIDEDTGQARGQPEPITSPAPFTAHLSLAGTGTLLAYSAVLETQNIQKLRVDPVKGEVVGDPVAVTTGTRFWSDPDPSPDGTSVVFYSQVGPEGDLYVANSDGIAMRQLTDDVAIDRVPRWSPDGEWISMFSDRGGTLHAWEIRRDGSDLRQLTRQPSSVTAWSPDGRRLAISRRVLNAKQGDRTASIIDAHVPLEGGTVVDLPAPPPPFVTFNPNAWSPDGTRIAGQNGFTTPGFSIYSTVTKTFERAVEFGEWPVWLPDGKRILFVARGHEFHVFDTRTKELKRIYSVKRDTLGPPRLTRDGRDMYFSRRVTEADIWVAKLR